MGCGSSRCADDWSRVLKRNTSPSWNLHALAASLNAAPRGPHIPDWLRDIRQGEFAFFEDANDVDVAFGVFELLVYLAGNVFADDEVLNDRLTDSRFEIVRNTSIGLLDLPLRNELVKAGLRDVLLDDAALAVVELKGDRVALFKPRQGNRESLP